MMVILDLPQIPVYAELQIEGWTVRAETSLVLSDDWKSVRAELEKELKAICAVVPKGPLAKLKGFRIWMRVNDPSTACAAYHPGAEWLKEHRTDPAMAKGIEIANAKNFVAWTAKDQPWMVLHELAHAYHDQVLSFDNALIKASYERAMKAGMYDKVRHNDGRQKRHYACTNPAEFWAEATESYFGKNDFYPFNRDELKAHDPATFELLRNLWGEPRKPAGKSASR